MAAREAVSMNSRISATAAFVLGIWAWGAPFLSLALALPLATICAVWLPDQQRRALLCTCVFALLLGTSRAGVDQLTWLHPESLKPDSKLTASGTVLESPRTWGKSQVFFFEVESVDGVPLPEHPIILVRWAKGDDTAEVGDRWKLSGLYSLGETAMYPGGFSQRRWLWSQRAHGVLMVGRHDRVSYVSPPVDWSLRDLTSRLRLAMQERLQSVRDPEARALVAGVVFGDTQALPKEIAERFRRTGTSHLLAASGMNVALLIGIFAYIARSFGLGPWRLAPALIPLVITYAFLAGCAPSITRAATAGCVGLLAGWLGRQSGAWNCLCLSVWVLLLWEPRQLYDLGFGLSVAAVIGLLAGPKLPKRFPPWSQNILLTISATLLTLPFMWTSFHEISKTFLPANMILGPLVEALFPLGLLLTLLPVTPLAWLIEGLAKVCLLLVKLLSALSDPYLLAHPGALPLALLAVAVTLWLTERAGKWRWSALPLAMAAISIAQAMGGAPLVEDGEVCVRQIGQNQPVYWISSRTEELLVISEPWQETRARSALVGMGCLRPIQLKVLSKNEPFDLRWGAFQWGKVYPHLPKGFPYTEVRSSGCTYTVKTWRPEHED